MPKKQVILLRTSERTAYKRCRFAWDVTYNQRLRPAVSAPPLRFGTLIHKAMELRYPPGLKRGPLPAETFEKAYAAELKDATKMGFRDENDVWHDAAALGVDMLEHYVEEYGRDDEWKVIASELTFQVTVLETDRFKVVYVGILDAVWQHRVTKEIWIRDWKTAKSVPENHGGHLTLDEQPGSYWAYGPDFLRATGVLKPNQQLQGIDFFYMRKAMRDTRARNNDGHCLNLPKLPQVKALFVENGLADKIPKKGEGTGKEGVVVLDDLLQRLPTKLRTAALQLGEVSSTQPATYFKRVPTYRNEAEQDNLRARVLAEAREHQLIRTGKMEVYKNPGQMTCGGCGIKDVCELHEAGQDYESVLKALFVPWDPYAEHEIRAAELR